MSKAGVTRRSFLGGTLAATFLAAATAAALPRRRKAGLSSDQPKPALPIWIGHI